MKKINFEHEWNFITNEIHKEKAPFKNVLKRELLFILQNILSNLKSDFDITIYEKSKNFYLNS